MPKNRVKAVLFDLGETLLSFGRVDTSALFEQGARSSYEFLKECGQPVGSFRAYCWRNLITLRLKHFVFNLVGKDFDALRLLKKIGAKEGYSLSEEQWHHLAWLWYEPLGRIAETETGIAETLGKLKEMGLKLGIVSNTFISGSALDKHLEQLGLLRFFPVRLYSYEFSFRKPDLRIFYEAAERIGEKIEDILFVGDRIDKDVNPAVQTGMQAALKSACAGLRKRVPKGAWTIERLAELPELIRAHNNCSECGVGQSGSIGVP